MLRLESALKGIDKHLGVSTVVAHRLGNDRSDRYQLPTFPTILVQILSILVRLELDFALLGIGMGVVEVDGLVLPHFNSCGCDGVVGSCVARLSVGTERGQRQEGKE